VPVDRTTCYCYCYIITGYIITDYVITKPIITGVNNATGIIIAARIIVAGIIRVDPTNNSHADFAASRLCNATDAHPFLRWRLNNPQS
jgi:hypothetical protein